MLPSSSLEPLALLAVFWFWAAREVDMLDIGEEEGCLAVGPMERRRKGKGSWVREEGW